MMKKERGQATLEFIIIAPLLFFMVALIAYAGWHSYAKLAAQNAAYGWMIFLPTQKFEIVEKPCKPNFVGGFWGSRTETLHKPTGMKEMWDDSASNHGLPADDCYSRFGGASVTISVFPGEIDLLMRGEIARGEANTWVPKGTAFFHIPPLISAKPE